MAEGWCRHLNSDQFESTSAGIEKHGLNSFAIWVMAESDVDITSHYSKTTADLGGQEFYYVVTFCCHVDKNCPFSPAQTKVLHHGFDDPSKLAEHAANEKETLVHFRHIRDEIRAFIAGLPDSME